MSGENTARSDARNRVRDRMVELNRARVERDERIEQAVTAGVLAVDRRVAAHAAAQAATEEIAAALRLLAVEQVSVDDAAMLVGLEVGETRRLLRDQPEAGAVRSARRTSGARLAAVGPGTGNVRAAGSSTVAAAG